MRDHFRSVTESTLIEIVGVAIFAAVVALVADLTKPTLSGVGLIAVGLLLAIVPAALWLIAFYRQDSLEPEPKRYLIGMFLLGAILAQAVGQPLIRGFFQVQQWAADDLALGFLASIVIVGMTQEFLKYAAVRYTIFGNAEFDQPVDGIIYAASAGLGYATVLNLQYVISNGGVDLGVGVIRCTVEALAQASTAGVVGYFLGQAKFNKMGPLWMPIGLLLAAALNGVINLLLDRAPLFGMNFGFNIWAALIAAVIVSGAIFAALLVIMRRLNNAARSAARSA
jgi:RsiW-degrading membrane proteinase PrsW (M82 family)